MLSGQIPANREEMRALAHSVGAAIGFSFGVVIEVVAEFNIDRRVWRTMGYGDQPAKAEVATFIEGFLVTIGDTAMAPVLRYMGAPGHYRVAIQVVVDQPWWRRMGYGDSSSVAEVWDVFHDFLARFSKNQTLSVDLVKE